MASTIGEFLDELESKLRGEYTLDMVDGPHDWTHPFRVAELGPQLSRHLGFDRDEFRAAAWLHNLDRHRGYKARIEYEAGRRALGRKGQHLADLIREERREHVQAAFREIGLGFLEGSPFGPDAQARILEAAAKHATAEWVGDSGLLTALKSADRIDWLGPIGIGGAFYFWTANGMYDAVRPFDQSLGDPRRDALTDMLRQLEWYAMLPSDGVREIADERMKARMAFMRAFAAEISAAHRVPNTIESALRGALGPYYSKF